MCLSADVLGSTAERSAMQELQARVDAGAAWGGKQETPGDQHSWQQQASTNQRPTTRLPQRFCHLSIQSDAFVTREST